MAARNDVLERSLFVPDVLPLRAEQPEPVYRRIRSVFDPTIAILGLLACWPLLFLIAIWVRLDSPGPALFWQERVGCRGRVFRIVKFRTMFIDAPRFSIKRGHSDPLVTRVGRFLRATGLDELPQLWNVARGEMALIGPRPEQLHLLGLYEDWQLERLAIKPGVTGWWQIHHRDNSPLHENVEKDIYYIKNQSLMLDLWIVIATARLMLRPLAFRLSRSEASTEAVS